MIVRGDNKFQLLELNLDCWKEKGKAEEEREAYLETFKEMTEALKQKNF